MYVAPKLQIEMTWYWHMWLCSITSFFSNCYWCGPINVISNVCVNVS